jgi:hypothetical protein
MDVCIVKLDKKKFLQNLRGNVLLDVQSVYVYGQSVIWPNEMTREAIPIDFPRLDSSVVVVEHLAYIQGA